MADNLTFIQSCADRLGFGWSIRGCPIATIRSTVFQLLGGRPKSVAEIESKLAAYRFDANALNPEEKARLFTILVEE
jgi:hypothetical protein